VANHPSIIMLAKSSRAAVALHSRCFASFAVSIIVGWVDTGASDLVRLKVCQRLYQFINDHYNQQMRNRRHGSISSCWFITVALVLSRWWSERWRTMPQQLALSLWWQRP